MDCLTPVDPRGMPPINKDWAVGKIASELKDAHRSQLLFCGGNNDFENEMVTDARRASCFWGIVQSALTSMSSPVHISELKAAAAVSVMIRRLASILEVSKRMLITKQLPIAGEVVRRNLPFHKSVCVGE
jgi:hypothetical protein